VDYRPVSNQLSYIQADDYVREEGGSQYKAMLMNQVVMGKAIKLYEEDQSLTRVSCNGRRRFRVRF
jgi:hypothetical protein